MLKITRSFERLALKILKTNYNEYVVNNAYSIVDKIVENLSKF